MSGRRHHKVKSPHHKMLMNDWRGVKLQAARAIGAIEELNAEEGVSEEYKEAYAKALDYWKVHREIIWKVPGHSYDGKIEELSEEQKEAARLTMFLLEETVKKLARELDEEDRMAEKNSSQSTDAASPMKANISQSSLPVEAATPGQSTQEHEPLSPITPETSSSAPPLEAATPTRPNLKRKATSSETFTIEPSLSPRPEKRARVASCETSSPEHPSTKTLSHHTTEAAASASLPKTASPTSSITNTPSHTAVTFPSTSAPKTAAPIRSILKRKAPSSDDPSISTLNDSPRPKKRVRAASYATVSSDQLTTSNPSPFHPPTRFQLQNTVQPHRTITTAETSRPHGRYYRKSANYAPGKWASPAFAEKANTSHCGSSWAEREEIVRRELEEWEEERGAMEGLKKVSGAWVVGWWLGNVVGRVDLEMVRKEVLAGTGEVKG